MKMFTKQIVFTVFIFVSAGNSLFVESDDICFGTNGTSTFIKNLTSSDSSDLLHEFQHKGCKGTPNRTTEQNEMLRCCSVASKILRSSAEMSDSCSNLNLLSITQVLCGELKRNEQKYHQEFKSLLSSVEVKAILGRLNYVDFHKTMLAIIYQNAFAIIRQVESEIGIQNDLAEENFRNTTKCLF